ncbi:MAG: winged helix DNA-binding domain-containing protein [Chloroflexales bacterium]|nr:winged helix DNA-binding domain-containing protein [Chloroflexales bacterium]
MTTRLELTRSQILAFRRRVAALDEQLPRGQDALRRAAWAGLQDSMPRAALLSIHARMAGTEPASWEDPSLVQVWGPRFSAYVVARRDLAVFTLGRLPDEAGPLKRAQDIAARLGAVLAGARMPFSEAARAMGESDANRLRYAAPTGTVVMRWDGARQPEIWNVPAPEMEPQDARIELARRYVHVFGPATPEAFVTWAGVRPVRGIAAFAALSRSLTPVRTPLGEAWILSEDESLFGVAIRPSAPARLLPSGDTWFLLQGADRELLVPEERQRRALWTSRVWPGALLVEGEIVGTWRRAEHVVTIQPWRRLSSPQRAAVEAEAGAFPLPGINRSMAIRWDDGSPEEKHNGS